METGATHVSFLCFSSHLPVLPSSLSSKPFPVSVCPHACARAPPPLPPSLSRRSALRTLSLALALTFVRPNAVCSAPGAIASARAALDACDEKISRAKWDGVRTVLSREPLVSMKRTIGETAKEIPEDLRAGYIGTGEDLLTALKLLDGAVYGNVFIGEDRQVLGTKVDFDTPRIYLRDAKDALDTMLDMAAI